MIDKAQVEQLLSDTRVYRDWLMDGHSMTDPVPDGPERALRETHPDKLIPILTDYLAMRAIVEALAASDPYDINGGKCSYCREYAPAPHHFSCLYKQARALIVPASGRTGTNPIEFDGVGEEEDG